MSFPAKAVLFDLPLKQEKAAKVTLQLVVNTGNIQIMTVASLEDGVLRTLVDLERDHVKIDAWRVAHGHEEPVLSSNQAFSRNARRRAVTYRILESTMRRSPQLQIAQRNCWRNFHVNETDSWHCCRLNLASSRGAFEGLNEICDVKCRRRQSAVGNCPRACQCPCLCTRAKSARKRERVRIVPHLSCSVASSFLFLLM